MDTRESPTLEYLAQEAVLFLSLSYIFLLGGTFNGLVLYRIKLVTFILTFSGGFLWIAVRTVRKWEFPATGLEFTLVLFLSVQALSTIFSDDPRRSLIQFGQLVLFALIFYALVEVVRRGLDPNLVMKVLLLVSGFVIVFGTLELVNWYRGWWAISNGSPLIPPATYRVRAFLGHPNFAAAYLNLMLPLGLIGLTRSDSISGRLRYGLWIGAVLGLIFFTSSRGGWLGTAAVLGTFGFFLGLTRFGEVRGWFRNQRNSPWKLVALILFAGSTVVGLVLLLRWQSEHPSHPTSWKNILGSRDYIWGVAWDLFRERPFFGNGPFTFGTEYIRYHSVPPSMILAHAHNYYLNILAESGMVGLAALAVLMGNVLYLAYRSWREHRGLSRIQLGGVFAALVGVSVHSLVETPQTLPAVMVILAVYLGLIASGTAAPRRKLPERIPLWIMTAAFAGLLLGWGWVLFSSRPYYRGVELANQQAEAEAASQFQTALKRDSRYAIYWFQAGLNHGKVASNTDNPVDKAKRLALARNAYLEGLAQEPNYSVNWMNLGLVYWEEGQIEQGLKAVEDAVLLAPRQPGYHLTYGRLLEEAQHHQRAGEAYQRALELRPDWAESAYFRETHLRREVTSQWTELESIEHKDPASRAAAYLEARQLGEAREMIDSLSEKNNPEVFYLRGKLEMASGRLDEAEAALQTAHWMVRDGSWLDIEINLALGKTYHLQEMYQQAAESYSLALSGLDQYSSFGFGTLGISEYSWYNYYRPAAAVDLLPGFEVIRYPDKVLDHFPRVISSYQETGRTEEADELYLEQLDRYQLNLD